MRELMAHIGKVGVLTVETDLRINIKILDVKMSYGNELVKITPLNGWGEKWVRLDRVTLEVAHNV